MALATWYLYLYLCVLVLVLVLVLVGVNKSDEERLVRVLKYLNGARELGLMLGGNENN